MQTVSSIEELIAEHPFLSGMDPHLLHVFNECGILRSFGLGQHIFREGTEADHFYLILDGEVALETFVPGYGMAVIQRLGTGDALGWSWLFPPAEWQFSASTLKPTEVISFDAALIRNEMAINSEFRDQLLTRISRTLVQRLHGMRMQLIDLYGMRP